MMCAIISNFHEMDSERHVTRDDLDKVEIGFDRLVDMYANSLELQESIAEIKDLLNSASEAFRNGDVEVSTSRIKLVRKQCAALVCGEKDEKGEKAA
jgi:hypothetical protein